MIKLILKTSTWPVREDINNNRCEFTISITKSETRSEYGEIVQYCNIFGIYFRLHRQLFQRAILPLKQTTFDHACAEIKFCRQHPRVMQRAIGNKIAWDVVVLGLIIIILECGISG